MIENADNNGDFKPETLKVISSDANTGLVEYRMRTIWDKTVSIGEAFNSE